MLFMVVVRIWKIIKQLLTRCRPNESESNKNPVSETKKNGLQLNRKLMFYKNLNSKGIISVSCTSKFFYNLKYSRNENGPI